MKGAGAILYILKGLDDSIKPDPPFLTSQGRKTLEMYLRTNEPPTDEEIIFYINRMLEGKVIPEKPLEEYLEMVRGSYESVASN